MTELLRLWYARRCPFQEPNLPSVDFTSSAARHWARHSYLLILFLSRSRVCMSDWELGVASCSLLKCANNIQSYRGVCCESIHVVIYIAQAQSETWVKSIYSCNKVELRARATESESTPELESVGLYRFFVKSES